MPPSARIHVGAPRIGASFPGAADDGGEGGGGGGDQRLGSCLCSPKIACLVRLIVDSQPPSVAQGEHVVMALR